MSDFLPADDLDVLDGPRTTTSLRYRRNPLAAPDEQLAHLHALNVAGGPTGTGVFHHDLAASGWPALRPRALEIFQINVGKLCNMTCRHCHVDSGPDRTDENMDRATAEACVAAMQRQRRHRARPHGRRPRAQSAL